MAKTQTAEERRQEAAHAEAQAAQWLGCANDRRERGLDDERQMAKAQHWLDRANRARGYGDGTER